MKQSLIFKEYGNENNTRTANNSGIRTVESNDVLVSVKKWLDFCGSEFYFKNVLYQLLEEIVINIYSFYWQRCYLCHCVLYLTRMWRLWPFVISENCDICFPPCKINSPDMGGQICDSAGKEIYFLFPFFW